MQKKYTTLIKKNSSENSELFFLIIFLTNVLGY
jgi:hypothetical protein